MLKQEKNTCLLRIDISPTAKPAAGCIPFPVFPPKEARERLIDNAAGQFFAACCVFLFMFPLFILRGFFVELQIAVIPGPFDVP